MLNLHEWASATYSNIGAVQGWSYCFLSKQEKEAQNNLVAENNLYWSFVTFCISGQSWNTIKTIMYTYENFIDQISLYRCLC